MPDKMRWRYGNTNPVVAPVDAAVAIAIGDILWFDVDDAKPARMIYDRLGLAMGRPLAVYFEAQRRLTSLFLGVALQRHFPGEPGQIRVATSGVFEFDCRAGIAILGAPVGVEVASDGSRLEDQRVMLVGKPDRAIGRVAKMESTPATKLLVQIHSRVMAPLVRYCDTDGD